MNDLVCPGRSCPATQHELLVYRDENHLTGAFAESLAPMVRTRVFQLLGHAQSAGLAGGSSPGLPSM
jgi:hypothetical protein